MSGEPAQYDAFAVEFERHAKDSAYNAFYDRPAVLGLLGDVVGRRVLDAGCGPGLYAAELVRRGAIVTAFDDSEQMVRLARDRLGDSAVIRRSGLTDLTWLEPGSQDAAVMVLVLHHLDDRVGGLTQIRRVLVPDGRLVLSTSHPTCDWLEKGGDYFATELVEETWRDTWQVRYWRQPLEKWCSEFTEAGFVIESLIEPRPVPEMAERYPGEYAKLVRKPGFIVFSRRSAA